MQALKKLMLLTVVIASIIMCDFATGLTTKEIFEKHIEPKVTGITKDHEPTPPPKLPCAGNIVNFIIFYIIIAQNLLILYRNDYRT